MTLVAGCYERFIFTFALPNNANKEQKLSKGFSYPGHQGAVKCIASGGTFIVSGGADDQLHIYEVQSQKDLGFLLNPGEGPISAVALYVPVGAATPTHLFSGGADGTLAVWSAGHSWDCLKVMTGHRKEITSLSIHPSGKLALSTSRDSTLRIWDLVKGRCSYHHILDAVADIVSFSPSGALYALVSNTKVTVHKIGQEAGLCGELPHTRRVLCLAWCTNDVLLTGTEAGSIHAWNVTTNTQICDQTKAHQTRIRGLTVDVGANADTVIGQEATLLGQASCTVASIASDGTIKTWHFDAELNEDALQPVAELASGARLTCLTLVRPVAPSPQAAAQFKQSKAKQGKLAKKQKAELAHMDGLAPQKAGVSKLKQNRKGDKVQKAESAQPDLKRVGVVDNGVIDFTDAAVRAHTGPTGANSVQLGNKGAKRQITSGKTRRSY